jgi:hypothetical protein
MPRFTQPDADQAILLHKLKLDLPQQPPPRIRTRAPNFPKKLSGCSADLFPRLIEDQGLRLVIAALLRKTG